jgi:prevent-host-death family protein
MEQVLPASEARQIFAEIVDRANFAAERFIIAKSGRNVAVLMGYDEYMFMKKLEDQFDLTKAKEVATQEAKTTNFKTRARTRSP